MMDLEAQIVLIYHGRVEKAILWTKVMLDMSTHFFFSHCASSLDI